MRDLSTLTPDHFGSLRGAVFSTGSRAGETQLQCDSVQYPRPTGGRGSFSVFWLGPAGGRPLPQGVRKLRHPELGELELFLVPVEEADGRIRCQAVFT